MEELLITALIGWIITKGLNKKEAEAAAAASTTLAPGYSQKLGKVIKPWPSELPNNAAAFHKLFTTDENFIYPGALCQWPQKYQVHDAILQGFVNVDNLARQYSQLSPPDRDGRLGDDLQEKLEQQRSTTKQLYQDLVLACGSYRAGSGGSSSGQAIPPSPVAQTFAP
jgi:hypothetical protein